jgi:hypothetical protein
MRAKPTNNIPVMLATTCIIWITSLYVYILYFIIADADSDVDQSKPECCYIPWVMGSIPDGSVIPHTVGRTDKGVGSE